MKIPTFKHEPLDSSVQQIRLLRLPRRVWLPDDTLDFAVEHFDLDSLPPFHAISYTWGPPEPTRTIMIWGPTYPIIGVPTWHAKMEIRENLFQFLELLPQISKAYRYRYFWIDQMCIDQENVLERNHQVKYMGEVFQRAVEVLVWLGAEDETSNQAMEMVASRANLDQEIPKSSVREYDTVERLLSRSYFSRLWIVQEVMLAEKITLFCGTARLD